MTPDKHMIDGICRRIDADLGDGTTAAKLKNFEAVILAETLKQNPAAARRQWATKKILYSAAAIVLMLLTGAVYLGIAADASPLLLKVGGRSVSSLSQTALHTGENGTEIIQFANRSSIKLMTNTDAALEKATADEVVVSLSGGELFLDVEGKESEHWIVNLGKYRVSVLGTQFFVKWHQGGELLDVRVVKGTVLVEGPYAGKVGIAVHRDTHLRLDTQTGFAAMNTMSSQFYDAEAPSLLKNEGDVRIAWNDRMGIHDSSDSAADNGAESAPVKDNLPDSNGASGGAYRTGVGYHSFAGHRGNRRRHSRRSVEGDAITSSKADSAAAESDTGWLDRLAIGDAPGAIVAAEAAGFTDVIENATLAELWQLMNAARKSGRDDLSEQILLICRRRFATSHRARLAAFVLGKVHYYGKNDAASAAQWFQTYLSETPGGPLAEEAMGRLVAIHAERGNTAEAKKLAQKYLQQYPTGAFSKTCRELMGD